MISDNLEQMQKDLEALSPKSRLEMIVKLSQFVLPKLQAVDLLSNEIPQEYKFIFDTDEKDLKRMYGVQ